jgi:carbon-monoxide dehydrogenase medium subunit
MVAIVTPTSVREAVELVRSADGAAKYLAGGTALVLLVKMRMLNPDVLVSLRDVADLPGFDEIAVVGDTLRIGGGVTMTRVARDATVQSLMPSLAHACAVVGNLRIRNCATMGGAMAEADYAADPPATLVSLGASVEIADGVRTRTVAVADFITDFFTTTLEDEEIVAAVTIPIRTGDVRSRYVKFCSRSAEDRPCVGVATSVTFDGPDAVDLRVVIGAVSGRPQWFPDITDGYLGTPLTDSTIATIASSYADAVDPVDDIRGSSWYRRKMVNGLVKRSLGSTAGAGRR